MKGVEKEITAPVTLGGITKIKDGKEVMGIQTKFYSKPSGLWNQI